jgi:uncharacterized protein
MTDSTPQPQPSMLLAFQCGNYRSFRDPFTLSLLATRVSRKDCIRRIPWRRPRGTAGGAAVDDAGFIDVLPATGIFGPNASGKSNVLQAMNLMRAHVLNSFISNSPLGPIPRPAFSLDKEAAYRPTRFHVDLVLEGVRHLYGFEHDDNSVLEEWATWFPNGKEALLFHRVGENVSFGGVSKAKGRTVTSLLRKNALFLSTAAQANYETLMPLFHWFERNLDMADENTRPLRLMLTSQLLENEVTKDQVLRMLRAADLGLTGVSQQDVDEKLVEAAENFFSQVIPRLGGEVTEIPPSVNIVNIVFEHLGAQGEVQFRPNDESLGTLVWVGLVGAVIRALSNGSVLLVDELDASLHPTLVHELIELFQNPLSNPNRGQLIFNSHDPTMLGDSESRRLLGRDQIWFTEKNLDGSTRLYPLSDLNPRADEAISRRYMAGRYGAIPILSRPEFASIVGTAESDADDE